MAFVNEPMGEAGVKLIEALKLPDPVREDKLFFDMHPIDPEDEWTVDYKNNLRFFSMWGIGIDRNGYPKYCCLLWGDTPIRIDAYQSGKGSNTVGVDKIWHITSIYAPLELESVPSGRIKDAIKEAFVTYTNRLYRNVKSIEFPSMSEVSFVSKEWMWRYH